MNEIRTLREKRGISQVELGIKSAIPPSRISMIERGVACNRTTAARIAAALNEKPEAVFPNFKELRGW